jgi:hypothetical protein
LSTAQGDQQIRPVAGRDDGPPARTACHRHSTEAVALQHVLAQSGYWAD